MKQATLNIGERQHMVSPTEDLENSFIATMRDFLKRDRQHVPFYDHSFQMVRLISSVGTVAGNVLAITPKKEGDTEPLLPPLMLEDVTADNLVSVAMLCLRMAVEGKK